MSLSDNYRSGFIALVGRPNVGKSTLLNQLVGQKVTIVSRKPQTTRHRVLGIHTTEDAQFVYVDTPGMHQKATRAMNRYMNRIASNALADVDTIIFVVNAGRWTDDDEMVLDKLKVVEVPIVLAVNKIDRIADKTGLLPVLNALSKKWTFAEIVPVSATKKINLDVLEKMIKRHLPESPPLFPADQVTDRSERFMAAELIREQLMRALGQELPYATTVEIEAFEQEENLARISALIWVERPGQKAIVVGSQGSLLKRIGQDARSQMERIFGCRIYLQLWVKVREGWSDDERALRSLGYEG